MKIIYLDHAAATAIDPEVARLMALQNTLFGNPSSIHKAGVLAKIAIETARKNTAKLIFAEPDEIIFTGSGSESNALAILGIINRYTGDKIPHIITSSIEHPSVLENCRMLEKSKKVKVSYISPDSRGIIDPKEVRDALRPETVLVSIMYANNEIGTIQPIREIAKTIRHFRKNNKFSDDPAYPFLHTDACQAMNYLPTENIARLGVELMTWNSSKIYGPKGVGFLYKKRGVSLAPLYMGGGQESGLRSGTENTGSIVAASKAFEITNKLKQKESKRLAGIRDYGIKKLLALSRKDSYEIMLNGDSRLRLPNNINVSIPGLSSELLVIELDAKGIEVSAKSACKSDEPDESYNGSLRITLGRETSKKDMDSLAKSLKEILEKYKKYKKNQF